MISDDIELPFLPTYESENINDGWIKVIWFEPKFSQSHYNVYNKPIGSNACTLIAVLMACKCHQYQVIINEPLKGINARLIHLLAASMLEGNRIYENLEKKNMLKHQNLNVPEALTFSKSETFEVVEWKSLVFMEHLSESLYKNLKATIVEWVHLISKKLPSDLYILLIADSRTVLFLVQSYTVSIFDSHQHATKGALIAVAKLVNLKYLCMWFGDVLKKCYNSDPKLYELSFIYFRKK